MKIEKIKYGMKLAKFKNIPIGHKLTYYHTAVTALYTMIKVSEKMARYIALHPNISDRSDIGKEIEVSGKDLFVVNKHLV